MNNQNRVLAISVIIAVLAIGIVFLLSGGFAGAESEYEWEPRNIHWNLKDDDGLSLQTADEDKPATVHRIEAVYEQSGPFARSNREWVHVGTWTSDPFPVDTIMDETIGFNIWFQVMDSGYEAMANWEFNVSVNDNLKFSALLEESEESVDEPIEVVLQFDPDNPVIISEGATLSLRIGYEAWEDCDFYLDSFEYDAGFRTIQEYLTITEVDVDPGEGEAWIEFAEKGDVDWDISAYCCQLFVEEELVTDVEPLVELTGKSVEDEDGNLLDEWRMSWDGLSFDDGFDINVVMAYGRIRGTLDEEAWKINAGTKLIGSRIITEYFGGSLDSEYQGIHIDGDYAYVATISGMSIIDISDPDPDDQEKIGFFKTEGMAHSVFVDGDYAYVADGPCGLVIIDISNSPMTNFVSSFDTEGNASGIFVVDNYAYVADGDNGLLVINVQDKRQPVLSSQYISDDFHAYDVVVDGSDAYVAAGLDGLYIIDISDPDDATRRGDCDTDGTAMDLVVDGNYVFVADFDGGMAIIETTDPTNPRQMGTDQYDTIDVCYGIDLFDTYAYLSEYDHLEVVDVSNRFSPSQEGWLETGCDQFTTDPNDLVFMDDVIYMTNWTGGLLTVDVLDNANPTVLASFGNPCIATEVIEYDDILFVGDGVNGGVTIVDNNNLMNQHEIGWLPTNDQVHGLDLVDHILYIAQNDFGLEIYDLDNLYDPQKIGEFPDHNTFDVVVIEDYAYTADGDFGLVICDISDPSNIKTVGSLSSSDWAKRVEVHDQYAYLAAGDDGVIIVDVSDPSHPAIVGELKPEGSERVTDITVKNGYVYFVDEEGWCGVIDVNDPNDPKDIFSRRISEELIDISIQQNHLFISDYSSNKILIMDIKNPEKPRLIGEYVIPYDSEFVVRVGRLQVEDELIYLSSLGNGLMVVSYEDRYVQPMSVNLVSPDDESVVAGTRVDLEWEVEGDYPDITFDLYLDDNPNPHNLIAEDISELTHRESGLNEGETYYWKIIATYDEGEAESVVWSFRVNSPPTIDLIRPEDDGIIDETEVELRWEGNDEDEDTLEYHVLVGEEEDSLVVIQSNLNSEAHTLKNLENGMTYYWQIEVHDGQVLVGSEIRSFSVHAEEPRIISTEPGDGAEDVAVDTEIRISFDRSMNRNSVESAILTDPHFSFDGSWEDTTLIIEPYGSLDQNTEYTIIITEDARDADDIHLRASYEFSFTTDTEDIPPQVVLWWPEEGQEGVQVDLGVVLMFSEDMDKSSVESAVETNFEYESQWDLFYETMLYLFPVGNFRFNENYYFDFSSMPEDLSGNKLVDWTRISFTSEVLRTEIFEIVEIGEVSDEMVLRGNATPIADQVEVRILNEWVDVDIFEKGLDDEFERMSGEWEITIDTNALPNGNNTITVRCVSGDQYSEISSVTIFVNNNQPPEIKSFSVGETNIKKEGSINIAITLGDDDGIEDVSEVRLEIRFLTGEIIESTQLSIAESLIFEHPVSVTIEPGTYNLVLIITDSMGEEDERTIVIAIEAKSESDEDDAFEILGFDGYSFLGVVSACVVGLLLVVLIIGSRRGNDYDDDGFSRHPQRRRSEPMNWCPSCHKKGEFFEEYDDYYCWKCEEYFQDM